MIGDLLFLMLAGGLLLFASMVVLAKNPMLCVLGLVATFFNAAGLFILLGAEFLGLLMIMVYVGAIAVMFLFVLMTIDIDFAELKEGFAGYLPLGVLVAVVLLTEVGMAIWGGLFTVDHLAQPSLPPQSEAQNIVQLGEVLFVNYAWPFLLVGVILLVAMVGAIVLTHRVRPGVRKQNIAQQIARKVEDAVMMTTPESGRGVTAVHFRRKKSNAKRDEEA